MSIALFHFDNNYATYSNWVFVYDKLDTKILHNQIYIYNMYRINYTIITLILNL